MRRLPAASPAVLAVLALLLLAASASAQTPGSNPQPEAGRTLTLVPTASDTPPKGRRSSPQEIVDAALRVPKVRRERDRHPTGAVRAYLKDRAQWQVSVFAPRGRGEPREREVAQVILDDATGRVAEAWTGHYVAWTMARGYPGAFGRRAAAVYIWIPLLVLFVLPFLRPPFRMVHLDLAAVAALSISWAFFNEADIEASVPLAYPPLVYLLVRMLLLARARARRDCAPAPALRLLVRPGFFGLAIVFLLGFRLGLNVTAANVIDVGYAGVIGADRLAHGEEIYGHFPSDNEHGDTYGPVNYYAYLPFELVLPWRGSWDDLPSAHAAAAAFDLACAGLLWLLGRRLARPQLGMLLTYLWLACPWTLLVANSGANDTLVGVLVLAALLAAGRPVARGAALGAAALSKFAPLVLAPLWATYGATGADGFDWPRVVRTSLLTAAGLAAAALALLTPIALLDGGLSGFWDRTIAFQFDRDSPFSIWGLWEIEALQRIVQVAVVVLAIAVAFVPRRRDLVTLAALAAATLIGLELTMTHWFYLYVVWFLPLLLFAVLADHAEPAA